MTSPAPDEHRELLRSSVADFIQRGTDIARVRKLRDTQPGYDRAVWRQLAELGWLGILVPEENGGLGLGLSEMAIVAEGAGRALLPEPLVGAAVLAAGVLRASSKEPLGAGLLQSLAAGELIPALAWQENAGTLDMTARETRAAPFEAALRLNGTKRFVHGGLGADGYIVSAAADAGPVLAWVPAQTPGVSVAATPLTDGRAMATVALKDVVVPREQVLAEGAAAQAALERARDEALAMTGAELCGVMDRALEMSLEYLKTRVQFGKPIGSFQVLQHRAVDLHIQRELAAAALADITSELDRGVDAARRALLASRIKARCADAALAITREAIQLHGAIGFTDEYDAGLYLKRAMTLASWLGGATLHRRRYAQLMPAEVL